MDKLPIARVSFPKRLVSLGLSLTLALAALLLLGRWAGAASAAGASPAAPFKPAVTFVVTATADSPDNDLTDGHCHDVLNGGCSLRAAVQQLDHDSGGIIQLPAGTRTLTDDPDGDLQLQKNIEILGAGSDLTTIQGDPAGWAHRILRVQNGAQVGLLGITISGGNVPSLDGGGIDVISGTVTLEDVLVTHNTAGNGGGIYNGSTLELISGRINANQAITNGGGIYNAVLPVPGNNLALVSSDVSHNDANGLGSSSGGGLYNLGQALVVTTTFNRNTATHNGGGLANEGGGVLVIQASTISNNAAGTDGGGLYDHSSNGAELANSTLSANRASKNGGGLNNNQGLIDLSSVTVAYNVANGTGEAGGLFNSGANDFRLGNTLVAGNIDLSGMGPDCDGTFNSKGYNLVQIVTTACTLTNNVTGNLTSLDPKLANFDYYGGPTGVWGLQGTSPALDAGDPGGCRNALGTLLPTDQRGFTRGFDYKHTGILQCDIGAFELVLFPELWLPLVRS